MSKARAFSTHLSFSQAHKIGNIAIVANFVFPYICKFSSLFTLIDVSTREIRCQWVQEDYISKL